MSRYQISFVLFSVICLFTGCQPGPQTSVPTIAAPSIVPSLTPEPQINLPVDVNPLTGERVADPSLLKIPALLISISHFPATGRPQAGLSFAPFVYEYYITEGATRFLAVFYGQFPAPEIPVSGGCETRAGAFVQTQILLGNRVWLDSNENGVQDAGEGGIRGDCVNLYDAYGNLTQRTSTDSNGYYGFNVGPGKYLVEFARPSTLEFTEQNAGDNALDSDADPSSGRAEAEVSSDLTSVDAGLIPAPGPTSTPDPLMSLPLAQVGPVRSGRLIYGHISDYFQNSCLIYAFASEEVLAHLPQCHMVFHQLSAGGYMLDISEMRAVAEENQRNKDTDFDYTGNLYAEEPPVNGSPASQLNVYIAYQNQSGWIYDPLYRAYLRYVDTSEYDQAGILHVDMDRLTSRQLHFENIIVLYAEHEVVSPTNLDIHLDQGRTDKALLFRDGQVFKITWSTVAAQDERAPGLRRPVRFLNPDGTPAPLKPGHTWVLVVTPDTEVKETARGQWLLTFALPPGAR